MPAFNIYFQQQRDVILSEYVGSPANQPTNSEILRTLTMRWRSLSLEDRRRYVSLANREKVRFANELVVWNRNQVIHNKALKKIAQLQAQRARREGKA